MIRQCLSRIGLPALALAGLLTWVGSAAAQRGGGGGGGHASGGGHPSGGGSAWGGHAGGYHGDHYYHDRFFFGFGFGYPYYGWGWPGYGYGYGWPGYGYYGGYYGPYWDDPYYYAPSPASAYPPTADYYSAPSSPAPALSTTPPAPSGQGENPNVAHLRVIVPANAKVWFEDEQTTQAGPARYFTSPQLALDKDYVYVIKAQWQEDGHTITRERRVMLHAGDWITVDFTRTSREETLPPPKAKA
jgi:uncharacterized protein (TIGR03000 family)